MKKILALILTVAICFCGFTVCADGEFTARVETKSAAPGDVVELSVNLENNPGIICLLLILNFDTDSLKLIDVVDEGLVESPTFGYSYEDVPYKMLWVSAAAENYADDGTLVTLKFEVLQGAKPGMSRVTLTPKQENVFDVDFNKVALKVENGGIDILSDEGPSGNGNGGSFGGGISMPEEEETEIELPKTPIVVFDDVNASDWYYDYVNYVCENKMMNGVSATEFAPNLNLTRGMFVTVLYRIEGEPETEEVAFTDVKSGTWYEKAVAWASKNGIVNGVSDTEFAPDANITREQMAAIIHRYAKYKNADVSVGENTNILSYEDFDSVSEYAIEALQYVCGSGIINGTTASTLAPKENATRAQAAAIFMRAKEKIR